jgi:hypothetical protein
MKRLFFQALICATYLLAAGVNADDSASSSVLTTFTRSSGAR